MTRADYKIIRQINRESGRIAAVRWVRTTQPNIPFLVAKMVVDDTITNKRWTHPPSAKQLANQATFSD